MFFFHNIHENRNKVVEAARTSTRFGGYNYNILKKLDFLSSEWIIEKSVVSVNL